MHRFDTVCPGGGFSVDARVAPFTTSSGARTVRGSDPSRTSVAEEHEGGSARVHATRTRQVSEQATSPIPSRRGDRGDVDVHRARAPRVRGARVHVDVRGGGEATGDRVGRTRRAARRARGRRGQDRRHRGIGGGGVHTHSATVATGINIAKGGASPARRRGRRDSRAVGLDRAEEDSYPSWKRRRRAKRRAAIRDDRTHRRHQAAGQAAVARADRMRVTADRAVD